MKFTKLKILLSPLIAVLGSALLAAPVVKAQSSSVQISPTKTILSLNAGDKKQVVITVQNPSPSAAKYNALFDNFTVSDEETGEPKIIDDPTFAYGIKNWLSGPSTISVAGNARTDYTATATVPAGTKPGTYYGVIRFGVGGTSTSVGSLLFINVGTITQQVAIEELDTTGIHVDDMGQATGKFIVRLKNTGNGYTVPKLNIEILNDKKVVIETIDANKDMGGILPNGSIRKYTADFSNRLEPNKTYSARVTATAGDGKPVISEKNFVEAPVATTTASKNVPSKTKNNNMVLVVAAGAIVLLIAILIVGILKKKHHKLTTMPAPAPQQPIGQQPFPPQTVGADPESSKLTAPIVATPSATEDGDHPAKNTNQ